MKSWEHLWCYAVALAATASISVVWATEWERATRLRCEPLPGQRLVMTAERKDEIVCWYVTPPELWADKVRKDIKRRKQV